jgi:CBS domain-containing protein
MTRRVVTVTPDTPILTAAKLMLDNHISGLPVVDASARVVGIISETDLLREDGTSANSSPWLQMVAGADGPSSDPAQLGARKVDEIMSRTPVTVAPNASMAQACRLLAPHQALAGGPGRQACRHYRPRRPGASVRPVR